MVQLSEKIDLGNGQMASRQHITPVMVTPSSGKGCLRLRSRRVAEAVRVPLKESICQPDAQARAYGGRICALHAVERQRCGAFGPSFRTPTQKIITVETRYKDHR